MIQTMIRFKQSLCTILLLAAFVMNPAQPLFAQNTEDIVDRLDKALGVSLPSEYRSKIKTFAQDNEILKDKDGFAFTEQFIKDQMKTNWGINQQNQYLFVWDTVFEQITKKNIYTGEDGDERRLGEFEKVMDIVEACGKKYHTDFTAYMRQISEEAKKQSEEAIKSGLQEMIRFYNLYKKNPSNVRKDELEKAIALGKDFVSSSKEFNIDYKSILGPEILKFYGIE